MKKPTYSKKKNKKGCATLISTTSDNIQYVTNISHILPLQFGVILSNVPTIKSALTTVRR